MPTELIEQVKSDFELAPVFNRRVGHENHPHNPFRRDGGVKPRVYRVATDTEPRINYPESVYEMVWPQQEKGELDLGSVSSILAHAEHVPIGWSKRPLAQLIRRRIELGIDSDIHDATYWLSEFECSEDLGHLRDWREEAVLVAAAMHGQDPSKLPTSENKISKLFTYEVFANSYRGIISGDITNVSELEEKRLAGLFGQPSAFDGMMVGVLAACEQDKGEVNKDQQAEVLRKLNEMSAARTRYNHDAQAWLQKHGTTPREKLVMAWRVRPHALKDGCVDNPNSIIAWENAKNIDEAFRDMTREGTLPPDVGPDDIESHQGFVEELSRVYDGRTVIRSLADFIKNYSSETVFPAAQMELSDGSRVEVLTKDDPRIFTVGADTRCCMTATGKARLCVEAAYSRPDLSIMVLFDPKGKLAAHSVIFNNPVEAPSTVVVDNIETNEGRNRDEVLKLYLEFFKNYLSSPEMQKFDTVNLGVHSNEAYDARLKAAKPLPSVIDYTDAGFQVVLYEKEPAFDPEFMPSAFYDRELFASIERKVYGSEAEGIPSCPDDINSAYYPPAHSYVIMQEAGKEVVGYLVAYETSPKLIAEDRGVAVEIKEPDEAVLYIEDLAILPEYQSDGYGEKALRGMLRLADKEGKRLLFQARESTSWKILNAQKAKLKAAGYGMEELQYLPDYFNNGEASHLVSLRKL
jgi:ribosomal protein S18 acetylase RimI-like enzyme